MKLKSIMQFLIGVSFVAISACGGSGGSGGSGGDGEATDTITIDMAPLRVVGFGDDDDAGGLYPIVFLGDIPSGKMLLMRARDPFEMGDFYSIKIRDGFGEVSSGTPAADEGEPDNSPVEAATLTWGLFLDRGFNPLFDEDWFTFTSSGECCNYVFATSNSAGLAADPILEVYDPIPNLGPVTYTFDSDGIGADTLILGAFDPTSNLTLIGMLKLWDVNTFPIDINSFSLVFDGPTAPGDYPIRFAFPPVPDDAPGSVTGSIHIDQYDEVGGRIIGRFDITIFDVSRSTTVAGSFDVTRRADDPGLLTGFRSASSRATTDSKLNILKDVSAYMRND